MFSLVQELIQDTGGPETAGAPGSLRDVRFESALFELTRVVIRSGIPLIWIDPADSVLSVENLPFDADIYAAEGQELVKAYIRRLEATGREPVRGAGGDLIYLGETPQLSGVRWIPWLQASGLMLTALIGFLVIRYQRRAEQDKAWTVMARELAHQLGTPISSLKGWLEIIGLPAEERPGGVEGDTVAMGIEDDLVRSGAHQPQIRADRSRPGPRDPRHPGGREETWSSTCKPDYRGSVRKFYWSWMCRKTCPRF